MTPTSDEQFVHEARRLIADLRHHRRAVYWADLFATAALTWLSVLGAAYSRGLPCATVATLGLTLAICRSAILLHQITHLPKNAVPGYAAAWNVLLGVPFLTPSFVYERLHNDHHRPNIYRTAADPEHPPDTSSVRTRVWTTFATMSLLPAVLIVRWLFLAPAAAAHPRARAWVDAHVSSLCGNRDYRPRALEGAARRFALRTEAAAFAWTAALAVGVATRPVIARGAFFAWIALWLAGAITSLRGELLHRFTSRPDEVTIARQVRDSRNVPNTGWLSTLLLPAGIGYHALHHLDAALPYHAMEAAHDRLMATLPATSDYRRVTTAGLGAGRFAHNAEHEACDLQ